MTDLNQAQQRILAAHGLTEMPPAGVGQQDLRLRLAEAESIPDSVPVIAPPEETLAAVEYRGGRDIDSLDAVMREQWDWLNSDPIFRKPEAAPVVEAAALDAPINWATARLDTDRLHSEPPQTRIDVQHAFDRIRKVGPSNVRETDLLSVTKYLRR